MGKGERLRKGSQFTAVYAQGKTWAGNLVVLKALPNGLEYNRCGYVAGKRVGKAVVRNRMKRLLREIVRSTSMRHGWDLIFIARVRAAEADYQQLDTAVKGLMGRAHIIDYSDRTRGMGKVVG